MLFKLDRNELRKKLDDYIKTNYINEKELEEYNDHFDN